MSDLHDRLGNLTAEQRALLEKRLRARGLDPGKAQPAAPAPPPSTTPAEPPDAWRERRPASSVELGLYFFSDDGSRESDAKYRLTLESARFADEHGFQAVWTPERHFQPFGGLYPNPSVLGAALAAVTTRVGIRAGSVALPLHHPVRVAEEWAVVDNLSNGRVALSFASGWHPDDFILHSTPFAERKDAMFRGIEMIRRLWAGDAVPFTREDGTEIRIRSLPRPVQAELPVWITTAGNPETWERTGAAGANVLAALVGYSPEDLAEQIAAYRRARAAAGHDPATGIVTMVAHTYVGENDDEVRELVRAPMTRYLKTYLKQFRGLGLEDGSAHEQDSEEVARLAFEHSFTHHTLLGTRGKCAHVIETLIPCGVNEIACLVDFGLDVDRVLAALPALAELQRHFSSRPAVSEPGDAR
ncbi:MAG: LLM class flavin-dependent oxidoreductase [Gemmatimonadetes bacterium]|nr:LLM class flavin-dependent oxidoreductase [Gemmatimonadota bacterium]